MMGHREKHRGYESDALRPWIPFKPGGRRYYKNLMMRRIRRSSSPRILLVKYEEEAERARMEEVFGDAHEKRRMARDSGH